MKEKFSFLISKKFWLNKWTITSIICLFIIASGMTFTYLYNPTFIPESIKGFNKKVIDKVVNTVSDGNQTANPNNNQNPQNQSNPQSLPQSNNNNSNPNQNSETEGWQTYENKEAGYSVKYPEGWVGKENNNVYSINPSDKLFNGMGFYYYKNIDLTIEEWWDIEIKKSNNIFQLIEKTKIKGNDAIKYQQIGGLEEKHIVIKYEKKILDILIMGIRDNEIENILSTINF